MSAIHIPSDRGAGSAAGNYKTKSKCSMRQVERRWHLSTLMRAPAYEALHPRAIRLNQCARACVWWLPLMPSWLLLLSADTIAAS